ncbi:unnamed protein product [Ixodes persulcatus]
MWTIYNKAQANQDNSPGNLLLDGLSVGFSKKVEQGTTEVVSVTVRVAKLVGYCIQEQVAPCGTKATAVNSQVLEDVHVGRVRDGAHAGSQALALDVSNGLGAHIEHKSIHQGNIVVHARLRGSLEVAPQLRQECHGTPSLDVGVQILPLRLDHRGEVGEHPGRLGDLGQHLHLEVGRERVWQAHVAGEGTQDQVAHLDAVGRDQVAETIVVVAQELRKIVQQHQQHPQRALREELNGLLEVHVAQEWRQKLEQVVEELGKHSPGLLLRREGQHPAQEYSVRNELQPGVGEGRRLAGLQHMQRVAEGHQDVEAYGLQYGLRGTQLQEEHHENAVVR